MNARQAAKAAAKKIEELEDYNQRSSADNKAYVQTIHSIIEGKSPCEMCEEHRLGECEHPDCYMGKGCSEWWLRMDVYDNSVKGEDADVGEGILSASPVS